MTTIENYRHWMGTKAKGLSDERISEIRNLLRGLAAAILDEHRQRKEGRGGFHDRKSQSQNNRAEEISDRRRIG